MASIYLTSLVFGGWEDNNSPSGVDQNGDVWVQYAEVPPHPFYTCDICGNRLDKSTWIHLPVKKPGKRMAICDEHVVYCGKDLLFSPNGEG